jgi:CRISPR-associated protein Csb2
MTEPALVTTNIREKSCLKYTLARFALDGPALPLITDTLPLAEQARRALLSIGKHLARRDNPGLGDANIWPLSPAFWGKDEQGRPRTGHEHAFFLPADEDGDGRLDHLTVFAPMGFNALEVRALDRLRQLRWGEGEPLRLLLVGLGNPDNLRSPLFAKAASWISATPFVVTRYPKLRGRKRDDPDVSRAVLPLWSWAFRSDAGFRRLNDAIFVRFLTREIRGDEFARALL